MADLTYILGASETIQCPSRSARVSLTVTSSTRLQRCRFQSRRRSRGRSGRTEEQLSRTYIGQRCSSSLVLLFKTRSKDRCSGSVPGGWVPRPEASAVFVCKRETQRAGQRRQEKSDPCFMAVLAQSNTYSSIFSVPLSLSDPVQRSPRFRRPSAEGGSFIVPFDFICRSVSLRESL